MLAALVIGATAFSGSRAGLSRARVSRVGSPAMSADEPWNADIIAKSTMGVADLECARAERHFERRVSMSRRAHVGMSDGWAHGPRACSPGVRVLESLHTRRAPAACAAA